MHKRLPIGLTLVRKYISKEYAEQSLIKEGAQKVKPARVKPPVKVKEVEIGVVVYKPPYGPKLKLTPEQAADRLEELRSELSLTERRLEKLKETQRKNPEWKAYDKWADDIVTIGTRIEEQLAVSEMLGEEIVTLKKAMGG